MSQAALQVAEADMVSHHLGIPEKVAPSGPLSFSELLGYYRYWMRMRRYPEHLVSQYEQRLARFIEWCAERDITRPGQVTTLTLELYAYALYRRPDDLLRVCGQLLPVGDFFTWLSCHNLSAFNPVLEPRGRQL